MSYSIVVDDVTFAWADGTPVLQALNAAFPAGRTGLIGLNGAGKSTLLKIIAGQLRPVSGSVSVAGEVGYLPQHVPVAGTVADLLGITPIRRALHAIEQGSVDEADYAAVGDDWDVEERAQAELAMLGLGHLGLDRPATTLSGGEAVLVALGAQILRRPDVLLLDEPTNNLDLDARRRLYAVVEAWRGVMVVVSHDRVLLELVDQIADLRGGSIRLFGGPLSAYTEALEAEQETAERLVRTAGADVRRQQRELIEARTKLARRSRTGEKQATGMPKIVAGARKRSAQVTAGKTLGLHQDKLEEARGRLEEAEQAVREDAEIRVDLPETAVPAGRTVLTLRVAAEGDLDHGADADAESEETTRLHLDELVIRGPERIALTGPNGSGKTTLLKRIVEHGAQVPMSYLPQRLDLLDPELSVLDNLRAMAPAAPINELRARLARFLFRGERALRPAGTLSGGERFRASLAALLSADPAPQLLLLDEPTNNLDMASVRQLSQALAGYRGALIVVSHDEPFLESLGITRTLVQDREKGLSVT
ncbi:ABC-F family ATP-binding cassette domain-containing protein [Nonomuraea soli]|uniref:ATPase subunit of ABC transporter with duplicated ATPase domains n=1 Tax=Nonomuraea soli TaxID=1032476 RepID=A0A7W0HP35_9ACTN|nr:ABC-F family ATP-binding cassette domain-containing protein [Nonomuraea soli]MBA2890439.1 ATPase subunit of ABC transporter with duplicated ATPase domains [Nonomuraea soli]